jgi:hypothetical protein
LFIRYAKNGIYSRTVEDIINSAKAYIDQLLTSGDIPNQRPNSRPLFSEREAYAGLGYVSLEDDQFRDLLEYIERRRREILQSNFPTQAEHLLDLIGSDTSLFCRRIIHNNDSENVYFKTPILHFIPPNNFVERLLAANPEDRRTVAFAIKERYSVQQFNVDLLPELDWLIQVVELLKVEMTTRAGKVSSLSIKWIVDPYITDAISQLKETRPAPAAA